MFKSLRFEGLGLEFNVQRSMSSKVKAEKVKLGFHFYSSLLMVKNRSIVLVLVY